MLFILPPLKSLRKPIVHKNVFRYALISQLWVFILVYLQVFTPFHQVSLVRLNVDSVPTQSSSVVVTSSPSTSNMSSYSLPSIDTNFPHTSLTTTKPNSPPSCALLFVIAKELNANAISVHSNRCNGKLGHLSLTITTTAYLVKSGNVIFDIPIHPGTHTIHTDGATSFQITEANRKHDA